MVYAARLFALLLAVVLVNVGQATFNFTTCPSSSELWATNKEDPRKVPRTFNMSKFAPAAPGGFLYYELAFHDWTQKPSCPHPKCITSKKMFDTKRKQINDTFTIDCFGAKYSPALRFGLTDTPGELKGWWGNKFNITPQHGWIPDTIVDFILDPSGTYYDFVLELQCVQKMNHVDFVGINFYSRQRNPGKAYIDRILQLARDRGLGVYMDSGFKVTIVDQSEKSCGNATASSL
eukprot:g16021.t1